MARAVSELPLAGKLLGLSGSLGSGKTTFTRELLSALGSKDPVASPTFVLCHEYRAGSLIVEHWDLYRLKEAPSELLEVSSALRIVEWPERGGELMSGADLCISFEIPADGGVGEERQVRVTGRFAEGLKEKFV